MGYDDLYYFGSGVLVCKGSSTDNGKTVSVTNGSRSFSQTLVNERATFKMLPNKSKYTVSLIYNGAVEYSTDVIFGFGEYKEIDLGLTVETWEGVKKIIDSGLASTYITSGDKFDVTLSTGEALVYQANVNTY